MNITLKDVKNNSGLRKASVCRQTGRVVSVYDGELAGMDTIGGRWQTVCEDHSIVIAHETLKLAIWHSADPLGWCEVCMKEHERENNV